MLGQSLTQGKQSEDTQTEVEGRGVSRAKKNSAEERVVKKKRVRRKKEEKSEAGDVEE